jgi:Holliday junction resolvase RusA-like endonuclease
MTQRDKWKNRPIVVRYFAYRDELRLMAKQQGLVLPNSDIHLVFHLPMPKSWSEKKKQRMVGQPHQLRKRNDTDNLLKSVFDTLRPDDDGMIYDVRVTKYWARGGSLEIHT